ncbi:hypothetical protein AAY72_02120 [Alishewanella sp. WH16-1]|uniref:hypothetical protein n=1 Tax=Alishewanella sp. WH16-1 TaxID=1651088 RepID=UPI0007090C97|nr:hypothetical protein [Alishewanella sp. WH16-1]KRS22667.1 hypothetical protein AAY72_02120 [Alishewanella sp. WH16-1]
MSVKSIIIDTIKANELHSFTLDELRKLYATQGVTEPSMNIAKGLYKNIWNLKKSGMLELVKAKDPKENVYVVTPLMQKKYLQMPEESHTSSLHTEPIAFLESLNKRLNAYSSELATTSAEIQEYQELLNAFPEQGAKLNRNFQAAKERAFQLRGRLLAVENIMKSQHQ